MANHPLSRTACKQTLAYLDAARGNITKAAELAGIARGTFNTRLMSARRQLGVKAAVVIDDPSIVQRASEMAELEQLRKENPILRAALADRAKVVKSPPVTPKPRAGRSLRRVIIPDTHGFHIDPAAWAAFIADLKLLDPDEVVGLGDHIDCGGFLAAHHTLGYVAQMDEVSYEEDLNAWGSHLDAVQKHAPRARIHILEGNHEVRVERWAVDQSLGNGKNADFLRRAITPEYRLDYRGRGIRYARYGEAHDGLPSRGVIRLGKCFFTHGFALGSRAAENHARKIGGPVVYGHTHTPAAFFSRTVKEGALAAWNFGTLAKLAPRYMHNNPDNWGQGYGVQEVAASGLFTTIHVPIINGVSLLPSILVGK